MDPFPGDVLRYVLSFLGAAALSNCACVCRKWRDIIADDRVWSRFLTLDRYDLHDLAPFGALRTKDVACLMHISQHSVKSFVQELPSIKRSRFNFFLQRRPSLRNIFSLLYSLCTNRPYFNFLRNKSDSYNRRSFSLLSPDLVTQTRRLLQWSSLALFAFCLATLYPSLPLTPRIYLPARLCLLAPAAALFLLMWFSPRPSLEWALIVLPLPLIIFITEPGIWRAPFREFWPRLPGASISALIFFFSIRSDPHPFVFALAGLYWPLLLPDFLLFVSLDIFSHYIEPIRQQDS